MNETSRNAWLEANQQYLTAALEEVRVMLELHLSRLQGDSTQEGRALAAAKKVEQARAAVPNLPTLDSLCSLFGLSPFERQLLLLCAGLELDSNFAALYSQLDPQRAYPTFSLALAALPEAHWSALTPDAPLRRWRLIELGAGSSLVTSPLRIDERILHYLAGVYHLDEHLVGFVQPVAMRELSELPESHRKLAEGVATAWSRASATAPLAAIQLCGSETASKQAIAAAAAACLEMNLHLMSAHALPTAPHDLDTLMRLWEREAVLSNSVLLLDCNDSDTLDQARESLISRFIEGIGGLLLISGRDRRQAHRRPVISFDVAKPTPSEQRRLWDEALGVIGPGLNGQVNRLVTQFDLGLMTIQTVCQRALGDLPAETSPASIPAKLGTLLWDACRVEARPRLDDLAQRIAPVATWNDLVLPERQTQTLRELAIHVRQRARVYEEWGFAAKSSRGLGISALFAGSSGTGKTMAAEVLANELHLDLYRIDLSQVVNKYIGETEKNLRRVFDAAEEGGVILLFDEADALFGKRSEVKDSHDRYANIEISYLLQRMEAYRGLAILTTNMKNALDDAFLRRIRFVVQFPFPDVTQRAEIWRRIWPVQTPTEDLDAEKLAQLNVTGGHIRNIALHAAFLAAEAGEPVRMNHLVQAARTEYLKLEKPLTEKEIKGWV